MSELKGNEDEDDVPRNLEIPPPPDVVGLLPLIAVEGIFIFSSMRACIM